MLTRSFLPSRMHRAPRPWLLLLLLPFLVCSTAAVLPHHHIGAAHTSSVDCVSSTEASCAGAGLEAVSPEAGGACVACLWALSALMEPGPESVTLHRLRAASAFQTSAFFIPHATGTLQYSRGPPVL